jgi:hypothetical protein
LLRLPEEGHVTTAGPSALSRILGADLDPSEFCSVLSGNLPGVGEATPATMQCAPGGDCILDLRSGDVIRRAHLSGAYGPAPSTELRLESYELIRSGTVAFRALFEGVAIISHYPLPMRIAIENPDKKIRFVVAYSDADVNVPVFDDAFSLTDVIAGTPDK